ncbi:MAG: carbohydrate kinase [Acidobacteriia bacterium]|nr:carbohydrate kinase [Terriglobia bacterium]
MDVHVVGIGEVLWDLLLTGPQLGGAPANFAYHAHALGAQTHVITSVGNDDYGREIIRRFQAMGLSDAAVQVDETAPTGTATVTLSGDGLAHFTIQENVAWDHIALTSEAAAVVSQADAICFGSLAQRSELSRHTIQRLIAATPANALRVFDINLRQQFYSRDVIERSLQLANVLKLNDDELPSLAAMFNLTRSTENQMEQLARAFSLRVVALTRGANGSLLYRKDEEEVWWSECLSRPVQVVDTVGAGDSFTAALVLGLLRKMDLDEINMLADEVARYVCSQAGATPPMPAEFARKFSMAPE